MAEYNIGHELAITNQREERRMSLSNMSKGAEGVISSINGDTRFLSRITSIGLTPGCKVKIIKNDKNRPILLYSRDTMIALNKDECENIMVNTEVVS